MTGKDGMNPLWGRLKLTGTLAMFAMGTLQAQASPAAENDGKNPLPPEAAGKAEADQKKEPRPSQTVHTFNVPAGAMIDVAAAISRETGVKISVPERFSQVPAHGLSGVLTTEEALTKALAGTHLAADFLSPDQVTLSLRAASQEVTVTAERELASPKYTAPLRDLPMTLTVIPEGVIQNTGSTSLVEALRTVPGITFGAGEGGNPIGDRPFIRGVDSQSSTFVDGLRDIGSQSREVFNLESIDVSKGPSGSYAGRGASGGSLNLNTKMARRERFISGSFSPGTGSFVRGTVDGNAKLTSWMAGRLNALSQDSGVAGRDVVHANRYGFAPALLFSPGHRTRVFTNYYQLESSDTPDPGIPYNNPTFFARTDGRQQIFTPGDGSPLLVNRRAFYGVTSRDFRKEKVKTAFGRVDVDVREGMILRNTYRFGKSNQDYVYSQADDSQGNIYYGLLYRRALNRNAVVDTTIDQTDFSGSFKTGGVKHNFATGFEFSRERSWNATYTVTVPTYTEAGNTTSAVSASRCPKGAGANGGYFCTDLFTPSYDDPFNGVTSTGATAATKNGVVTFTPYAVTNTIVKNNNPIRQITGTRSLYGFDTIQFVSQLQATVGIRYDHYDSQYRNVLTCVPTVAVPCTFASLNDLVNYQGALTYKPKKEISIYGSVSHSSTPPGNALSQGSDASALTSISNQVLPPESTRSEEAGLKWEIFGGKALATGAFFQANTENVRITQSDLSIAAGGERHNRGVDLSVTGYVSRKLQVFGGYTFMSAVLQKTGITNVIFNGVTTPVNGLLDGRRYPNTPQNSFSLTSYYEVNRRANVGGGVYGVGKVFGADNPATAYTTKYVPGYVRVDLYGTYRFNRHFELQGNLQNVGNKTYYLQAYTTHYATLAPGRQGRLTLNVRF